MRQSWKQEGMQAGTGWVHRSPYTFSINPLDACYRGINGLPDIHSVLIVSYYPPATIIFTQASHRPATTLPLHAEYVDMYFYLHLTRGSLYRFFAGCATAGP